MHKIKKRNCIDSADGLGRWRQLTIANQISLDGMSNEKVKESFKFDEKFEEESIPKLLKQLESENTEMDFRVLHNHEPFPTKIIWREEIPFRYIIYSELWGNSAKHLIEVYFYPVDDERENDPNAL